MLPATYNLDTLVQGDTWTGRALQLLQNGTPMDLVGSSVVMHLRTYPTNELIAEWATADATLIVSDPTELIPTAGGGTAPRGHGWLIIAGREMSYPPANYHWELHLTLPTGRRITLIRGRWKIIQPIAYP